MAPGILNTIVQLLLQYPRYWWNEVNFSSTSITFDRFQIRSREGQGHDPHALQLRCPLQAQKRWNYNDNSLDLISVNCKIMGEPYLNACLMYVIFSSETSSSVPSAKMCDINKPILLHVILILTCKGLTPGQKSLVPIAYSLCIGDSDITDKCGYLTFSARCHAA